MTPSAIIHPLVRRLILTPALALVLSTALAGSASAQSALPDPTPLQLSAVTLLKAKPGSITRLEDLVGLPCGTGSEAGALALAINPLSGRVEIACARPGEFLLDVAVGGPGSVLSVTPEITCGFGAGDCMHTYDGGAQVTLATSNEAGTSAFAGWGGACSGSAVTCQVTMDQARHVTATFLPTLTLHLGIFASARNFGCAFNICVYSDSFADSKGRVTVTDLDTGLVAGTCDTDTTLVVPSSQFAPPAFNVTDCNVPVVPGHRLSFVAEDSATLGGVKTFQGWGPGDCEGSISKTCTPADPVTVHEETVASFN